MTDHSDLFYKKPKWWQWRKRRRYQRLLETDQKAFDEEADFILPEPQE
jgi:hypothetical protein